MRQRDLGLPGDGDAPRGCLFSLEMRMAPARAVGVRSDACDGVDLSRCDRDESASSASAAVLSALVASSNCFCAAFLHAIYGTSNSRHEVNACSR